MHFELRCDAVLFDLDGVLVDSGRSVEFVWRRWAAEHGFDPEHVVSIVHGRRTADTVRALLPAADVEGEVERLENWEVADAPRVRAAPGALELLAALPRRRWGIVTSGSSLLAQARLEQAGIPVPQALVTGGDVREGKPSPECYLLGAGRLGIPADRCVVVEDAPAGIRAARGAGAVVVAVATTHPAAELAEADHTLNDLRALAAEWDSAIGGIRLRGQQLT